MIYEIIKHENKILRNISKNIEKGEFDVKQLSDDMFETMKNAHGVGLAAPQIGLNINLFVMGTNVDTRKVFINPVIEGEWGDEWVLQEGCLSISGISGNVHRKPNLQIRYFDVDWNEKLEIFSGMEARIIQHEYDHLNGVLFIDKMLLNEIL